MPAAARRIVLAGLMMLAPWVTWADIPQDIDLLWSVLDSETIEFTAYEGEFIASEYKLLIEDEDTAQTWEYAVVPQDVLAVNGLQLGRSYSVEVQGRDAGGAVVCGSVPETIVPALPAPPPLSDRALTLGITTLDSANFPFIYSTVDVTDLPEGCELNQGNFAAFEDDVLQTNYFEVTLAGDSGNRLLDMIFVVDNSGSMSEEHAAVRQNLANFANSLEAAGIDFRLGLVRFGQSSGNGNPILVNGGTTADSAADFINNFLSQLTASGSREPGLAAVETACNSYAYRPGSLRIFLLITDEDSDGGTLAGACGCCNSHDIVVHAAADCSYGSSNSHYCGVGSIRDCTGGELFNVQGPYDEILDSISDWASRRYVVRYRALNDEFDGQERQVRIELAACGENSSDTATYVPGTAPTITRTPETIALSNSQQSANLPLPIACTVVDDYAPYVNQVRLYYRVSGTGSNFQFVALAPQGNELWAIQLPGSAVQAPGVDYYLWASDGAGSVTDPRVDAHLYPYQIAVFPNEVPQIVHTPIQTADEGYDLPVSATVYDHTDVVDLVVLRYREVGDLIFTNRTMEPIGGDAYRATISGPEITGAGFEYEIRAYDNYEVSAVVGPFLVEVISEPRLKVVDAWPPSFGGHVISAPGADPADFASGGIERQRTVADGTSRLLLRYRAPGPGNLTARIIANIDEEYRGSLHAVGWPLGGQEIVVPVEAYTEGYYGMVVYRPASGLGPTPPPALLNVVVDFEGQQGDADQEIATLRVVHPPCVLVHGIWSGPDMWDGWDDVLGPLGMNVTEIDYSRSNWEGFEHNYQIVRDGIVIAKNRFREQGIACSQVNVIAHSMGGCLARYWAAKPDYEGPGNFGEGYINCLLTLDTPHWGSHFADYYYSLKEGDLLSGWCWIFKYDCLLRLGAIGLLHPSHSMRYGQGVRDLRYSSEAIDRIGNTRIPGHAWIGEGGTNDFGNAHDLGLRALDVLNIYCCDLLHPGLIFPDDHDYIVDEISQTGGLSGGNASTTDGQAGEHTLCHKDGAIRAAAAGLTAARKEGYPFAQSWPSPPTGAPREAIYAGTGNPEARIGARMLMEGLGARDRTADFQITAPADGSTHLSGTNVAVTVDWDPSTIAVGLLSAGDLGFTAFPEGSTSVTWVIPTEAIGVVSLDVSAFGRHGERLASDPISIQVEPGAPLLTLRILQEELFLAGSNTCLGAYCIGDYGDGVSRLITSSAAGTNYSIDDASIAVVDADGVVTSVATGSTLLVASNSGLADSVWVRVGDAPANASPQAIFSVPSEICRGETLLLDASASNDPDGETVAHAWDLDNDGEFDDAFDPVVNVLANELGTQSVGLQVIDISGITAETVQVVEVVDCGPRLQGMYPLEPCPGDIIHLRGAGFGSPGEPIDPELFNIQVNGSPLDPAAITFWSDSWIEFELPPDASSGELVVTADGEASPAWPFTICGSGECVWTDATTAAPFGQAGVVYGVAWGDYDNDGDQDLFLATSRVDRLLENQGGNFAVVEGWPTAQDKSRSAIWGDYDNDGDLDLYVVNNGEPNVLYAGDGSGGFTAVDAGDASDDGAGYNAAWADIDSDADLDLYVANETGYSRLYRNDDGAFVTVEGPTTIAGTSRACAFADYDNDGDQDLYVSRNGRNVMLANDGQGVFEDVSAAPLDDAGNGKGVAWGDYDNDGDPDLYLVQTDGANKLLANDGTGAFTDVTDEVTGDTGAGRSCAWADYDNDGWLDLMFTNLNGGSRLLQNVAGAFADSTCGVLQDFADMPVMGSGFADCDNDGDQDLVWAGFGNDQPVVLFRNGLLGSPANRWLQIDLRGTDSNSFGVGARIVVEAGESRYMREVIAGSGYLGQSSLTAEFGVSDASVVNVEVRWPSGIVQRVEDVHSNQRLVIEEQGEEVDAGALPLPRVLYTTSFPNPFNPMTSIVFDLPSDAGVTLRIFDAQGRLVRVLLDGRRYAAGRNEILWDGRDDAGRAVPSGVYLYRLDAGAETARARMLLLK